MLYRSRLSVNSYFFVTTHVKILKRVIWQDIFQLFLFLLANPNHGQNWKSSNYDGCNNSMCKCASIENILFEVMEWPRKSKDSHLRDSKAE